MALLGLLRFGADELTGVVWEGELDESMGLAWACEAEGLSGVAGESGLDE
ncbi:MAG: hypothetical protein ACKO71_04270 [Betaproteobacteria bacterium]